MQVVDIHYENDCYKLYSPVFDLNEDDGKRQLAAILRKVANDLSPYSSPDAHVMQSYA